MTEDARVWGEPMSALLVHTQHRSVSGLPSLGGKDSMSGSFNDIHSTGNPCFSFAVDVAKQQDIITPEFKKSGKRL